MEQIKPFFNQERVSNYRLIFQHLYDLSHVMTTDFNIGIPQIEKKNLGRIMRLFFDNDRMVDILSGGEFSLILNKEKELKGDCKTGVVQCIDGRNSILHQFGRALNIWEVPGSKIKTKTENGQLLVDSKRLIGVLETAANTNEKRDFLEIVTTHTSLKHRDHLCGAMTKQAGNGADPDHIDRLALQEAKNTALAIENTYNQIRKKNKKPIQDIVAITATIDNDTMGLILGYMSGEELSTTKILREGLTEKIKDTLYTDVGDFGSMRNDFDKPKSFIEYSKKVLKITEWLLKDGKDNIKVVDKYIDKHFSKLTTDQVKALKFTIARTLANQYVTGLAAEDQNHTFSEHDEKCLVVAPTKPFGRHLLDQQTFSSHPSDRDSVAEDVLTKLSIIDKKKNPGPEILFISNPMPRVIFDDKGDELSSAYQAMMEWSEVYYQKLLENTEIRQRLIDGKLIIIPIIVDDKNGEVIDIVDLNTFINQSKLDVNKKE